MSTKILFLLLLLANTIMVQQIATVGINKYSQELQDLIEENYEVRHISYEKINHKILTQSDVLALKLFKKSA